MRSQLICGAVAAVLAPCAATAGDNPPSIAEIIVTAQRRAERLQDVPLTVTVQTGEQLERANINETRDLVRVVPGLTMTTTVPGRSQRSGASRAPRLNRG